MLLNAPYFVIDGGLFEMEILMEQIVELTAKLTPYSRCNISVAMQLNKWVPIISSTDDWTHAAINLFPCLSHQWKTISITVD